MRRLGGLVLAALVLTLGGPASAADDPPAIARHLRGAQNAMSYAVVGTCDSFDRISRFRRMDRRLDAIRDAYVRRYGALPDEDILIIEGDSCTLEDSFEGNLRRAGMELKAAERLLRP